MKYFEKKQALSFRFYFLKMKKITLSIAITLISLNSFSKPVSGIWLKENADIFENERETVVGDCKLMEEKVNGVTQVTYAYDSENRLVLKKNLLLNHVESYSYDNQGFLIEISNSSDIGFNIKYEYENGLLVKKTHKINRIAIPNVTTYFYNASNELIKMSEKYISETITEFRNGKAINRTNPFINFELNEKGLITKSSSISGTETFNLYTYDSNDMLLKQEVYEKPGKKVMQDQFEISNVKRTKVGSEFVDSYKGMPYFKNPLGDDKFYINKTTKYTINADTNTAVKVFENQINHSIDTKGNMVSAINESDPSAAITSYVYSGCNK